MYRTWFTNGLPLSFSCSRIREIIALPKSYRMYLLDVILLLDLRRSLDLCDLPLGQLQLDKRSPQRPTSK